MSINGNPDVDSLVEAGRYADAAQMSREEGDPARAAELYERIWDFAQASECAEEAGDLPRALANAIQAKQSSRSDELGRKLEERGDEGKRAALEIYVKHRHFASAGRLAEELEELEQAVDCYQKAHMDLDAARVLSVLGRDRDAGRILERAVRTADPGAERSRANLALGLILARMMQHEAAVRCLQDAAQDQECQSEAEHALIVELAALGLRDAAREVLLALRRRHETAHNNLDAFLREHRDRIVPRRGQKSSGMVGGRYRLGRLLGSGASGRVFEAHDEVQGKDVALKLLASSHAHGDDSYQRFTREANIAKSLRHPNLVEVYDFSAELGYLVMELMVGGSLESKLRGEMSDNAVRRLFLDLLSGLELAHGRGIIHRDIKPANIFFDARGSAKLGDFGVAHLMDLGQTQTGGLIGTLAYMSPEQITGAPLTIGADLYGLGVTLFEALTGRLPFLGPDYVAQHLGEAPPLPSEVSSCSPLWDPIIERLLAKNPAERYDSIEELREDIQGLELSQAPQALLIPRAKRRSADSSTSLPAQGLVSEDEESSEDEERYTFETLLGSTVNSKLYRAIDTHLNRSVIIERFDEPLSEQQERRLYALARGGGPFLQRALGYERSQHTVTFEAPAGQVISELPDPISPRLAARLLRRLARALAPLHEHDRVHGSISPETILLDDRGHPTILVAGIAPLSHEVTPDEDIANVLIILSDAVLAGSEAERPSHPVQGLVHALLGSEEGERFWKEAEERPLRNAEELYAFAVDVEIRLLTLKRALAS